MSLGRPGRWTSPAEIMVVIPPLSPDSMKSIVRCRGVKSPNTGWQCESMSPGITVVPFASTTVSAPPSRPRPTAAIRPFSVTMESPSRSGLAMSPETICPMFVIKVFIFPLTLTLSPSPALSHCGGEDEGEGERERLDCQVRAAYRLVGEEPSHGPLEPDLPLLDDVCTVGHPRRELEILLGQENREPLALQRQDLLSQRLDDDRR